MSDKIDDEGFVLAEHYTIRLHLHGGPLDGQNTDITYDQGEQAGFGEYIRLPHPDTGASIRYERTSQSDWREASGADTHIDLYVDESSNAMPR